MSNIVRYHPEKIWPEILEQIANGASLATALKRPGMPSYALAKLHLRANPELRAAYDAAVRDRADHMAEELIELADTPIPNDLEPAARSAWVQWQRVRLDARKWLASRTFRQAWGERVDLSVNHTQISISAALEAANARILSVTQSEIDSRVGG